MNRVFNNHKFFTFALNSKFRLLKSKPLQGNFQNINLLNKNINFISDFFSQKIDLNQRQINNETKKASIKPSESKIPSKKERNPNQLFFSEGLKKLSKQIQSQAAYYITPLQHSRSYHYASYFLPTVRLLHSQKMIKDQKYFTNVFRAVKNSIKPTGQKIFSPQSVIRLLQQFSMIDFDGDEQVCLKTMLNYAEQNMVYFTQVEWQRFKQAYKQIMVNKAVGPVKFRPLTTQRVYQSETERKILLIKSGFQKMLGIKDDEIERQLVFNDKLHKKWIIMKVPFKNLTVITYPKILTFQEQETYSYIYDLKQTINSIVTKNLRQKNRILLGKLKINILIRQFLRNHQNSDFQYLVQKGLAYRQKKQIIDEFQKYEEMKKMTLKQQIQKMKEKKKSLKLKQKFKEKQKNTQNPTKLSQKNKVFDFFETLKISISQIQQETLQKLNKKKNSAEIPKKQKKKAAKKKQQVQEQEDLEQDQQYEQEDEKQNEGGKQERIQINPATIEKMKMDLENFNKRVAQKQQRMKETKNQKSQVPQIERFIEVNTETISVQKILNKTLASSTLQQVKQLNAYVEMIESFNNVMEEIDKFNRIKDFSKKAQQEKNIESQKGVISAKRLRQIKDQINDPYNTRVDFNSTLQVIFEDQLCESRKLPVKNQIKDKQSQKNLEHTILILSEEELLNAVHASIKKEYLTVDPRSQKKKQNLSQEQNKLKQKILKQTFLPFQK